MFNNFKEDTRKVLMNAKLEMQELKHPYIGSEHLLLSILKNKNEVSERLKDFGLTYDIFKSEIIKLVGVGKNKSTCLLYTPLLKRVMESAMIDSRENNNGNVTINHLFAALLEEGEGVAIRVMLGLDIDLDALYDEFSSKIIKFRKNEKLEVDEIGVDLTKKALNKEIDRVVGRENEIRKILEILSRKKKNNPILIGDAGVGKTAIVEELAYLIVTGDVPINLKNKRIISIDMASAVAGTKYRGEFEERINKMLKELEDNDDIILFIDEIHTIVGAGGAEGAIDASNIFKPALARNKMRLIGATTTEEYKKFIENDKALDRRFQKVNIKEPNDKELKKILLNIKKSYEDYHHVIIDNKLLGEIITLSNKYIQNRKQPDKAIDILDEVCAYVSLKENKEIKKYNELNKELKDIIDTKKKEILHNNFKKATDLKLKENKLMDKINKLELEICKEKNNNVVELKDIVKIVSEKANIPIYKRDNKDKKDILDLKNKLSKSIIGQDDAILELIKIYKQIKLNFKDDNPCSILFVGPSGVGKTKMAKMFAKNISRSVIKLDMSEYSESHSISKLIGSPAGYVGYSDSKNIFDKIKDNPFSVIILDELEKAHNNIISLFLSILDEGVVHDAKGELINFKNTIIIMTSNVGYLKDSIGFNKLGRDNLKENFSISFINRIDNIVHFNGMNKKMIKTIINNNISKLKEKYCDIKITVSKDVIEEIIELSNYEVSGARKIEKIIKKYLEDRIVSNIIENVDEIDIKSLKKEQLN